MGTEIGRYFVYAVGSGQSSSMLLRANCRISTGGDAALCQRYQSLFYLDLVLGQEEKLPISPQESLGLTPDLGTIYYVPSDGADLVNLYAYRISDGITEKLATIQSRGWSVFPQISSDGKMLVGVRSGGENTDLSLVDTHTGAVDQLETNISGDITDLAWSPDAQFVGIGSNDRQLGEISRCSTTIFSVYNISSKVVTQLTHAPSGYCFDWFGLYTRSIWSPDSKKVLLMSSTSICVLKVEERTQNCFQYSLGGEYIQQLAWSPDSRAIAYVAGIPSPGTVYLRVSSIDDLSHNLLEEPFSLTDPVTDLVWVNP